MTPDELRKGQLEKLKEAARIFLKPMERLPFPVVMEAMTGHAVLPIMNCPNDNTLLEALAVTCIQAVAESNKEQVRANRPNDVSVQVEERLAVLLKQHNVGVEKPKPEKKRGPGGYPDRLLWCGKEPTYLEVKVSREENIEKGSARNFFFQPTVNTKIRHDARHLLAGFAINEVSEKTWILTRWKIVDLWHLRVKLKPEYNADNLEIYREEAILMEGDGKGVVKQRKRG
jgi:hypothetical protein